MSKEWFSAIELSGLPDVPNTKPGIALRANGEGWRSRNIPCRGGHRREYHISSLPEAARIELAKRMVGSAPLAGCEAAKAGAEAGKTLREEAAIASEQARIARERGLVLYNQLPPGRKAEVDAIAAILKARDAFLQAAGLPRRRGTELFAAKVQAGEIELPGLEALSRTGRITISRPSIDRWERAYEQGGLGALARKYKGPTGGTVTAPIREFITAIIAEHPHAKIEHIHAGIEARFGKAPSYHAVRRFVASWKEKHAGLYLYLQNPDAYRSKYMYALGSASEAVTRLNQRWEMDSSPADVLLSDGIRYALLGVIDVYSRRFKLLVKPTSNAAGIAALIRRAIIDWGVPETIKKDNGKDYVARHIVRVEDSLGIEPILCTPFTPQEKPHIERAFRSFSHDLLELMPGFIGHSVADRKGIEARKSFAQRIMKRGETVELKMGPADLQAFCDRWIAAIYEQRQHDGLQGQTPAQAAREWPVPVRRISDERALDVLLAPAPKDGGFRVIRKKGLEVEGRTYAALEFAGREGERVQVLPDPTDLGRVYVYLATGEFLAVAVDPTAPEIDRAQFANHLKARQKQIMGDAARALKKSAKALSVATVGEEILAHAETRLGKVIELPKASTEYTTEALRQAARASEARDNCDRGDSPGFLLRGSDFTTIPASEPAQEPAEVVPLFGSDVELYDFFSKLRRRRELTPDELAKVRAAYEASSQVRMLVRMEEAESWVVAGG